MRYVQERMDARDRENAVVVAVAVWRTFFYTRFRDMGDGAIAGDPANLVMLPSSREVAHVLAAMRRAAARKHVEDAPDRSPWYAR